MVFNPDDPHDGHSATEAGFTYRMVHIGPELVMDALRDLSGRRAASPLFAEPVIDDPSLAASLRALSTALFRDGGATALRRRAALPQSWPRPRRMPITAPNVASTEKPP